MERYSTSTEEERHVGVHERGLGAEVRRDGAEEHIFLQPMALPSVLGFGGLAIATFVIGAFYAGWSGADDSQAYFVPLAGLLGGLAQFLAGMWAFRARGGTINGCVNK